MRNAISNYGLFLFIILIATGVVACEQGVNPDSLPEAPNNRLAYAVAKAMDKSAVRQSVHASMQASPFQHYKLKFNEFLQSEQGTPLQNSLTNVLGGEKALNGLLSELPDSMDFYLSHELHRETWTHSLDNIMVVVMAKERPEEVTAYRVDGEDIQLTSKQDMVEAGGMLFVIHTAETKIQHGREAHSGDTIEKPEGKTKIINEQQNGSLKTTQAEDGYIYVTGIDIKFSDGPGSYCEVYFEYYAQPGVIKTDYIEVEDQGSRFGFVRQISTIKLSQHSNPYVRYISVLEDDVWPNYDDYYGETANVTGSGTYEIYTTQYHQYSNGKLFVEVY